jgi:hypothetical protein
LRGIGDASNGRGRSRAGGGELPEEGDDKWDPLVGEGERESRTGLGSVQGRPWADSWAGPNRSPSTFSYFLYSFSFSFSVFLIYFVSFAKSIQINSNKFLNSSKIHNIVLKQQETCF